MTSLLLRVVLLPLVIRGSDTSARLATIKPILEPVNQRMKAAKAARDTGEVREASREMKQIHRAANIKLWTVIISNISQGLLGFGSFRLLKNMATLPVPGLDEGGLLWFKDLTLSDPYFVMPILTGLGLHLTFKVC